MAAKTDLVQGYLFASVSGEPELASRNGTICQLIERHDSDEVMAFGPMWLVRFGDGFEATATADELNPWYPID